MLRFLLLFGFPALLTAQSVKQVNEWVSDEKWGLISQAAQLKDLSEYPISGRFRGTQPLLLRLIDMGHTGVALDVLRRAQPSDSSLLNQAFDLALPSEHSFQVVELIEALLLRGAAPSNGEALLRFAIRKGSPRITQLYLDAHGLPSRDSGWSQSPFSYALLCEQFPIAEQLVKAGADIHTPNKAGITPLMLALQLEAYDIVSLLLDSGASIECRNERGEPPLILAARFKKQALVERLLQAGADSTARSSNGYSVAQLLLPVHVDTDSEEQPTRMPYFVKDNTCINVSPNDNEELVKCSNSALIRFISSNVRYPALARESAIEGLVIVSFVINSEGYVVRPLIVKNPNDALSEEALRIVRLMNHLEPRWQPGMVDNEVVSVKYNLPVRFKLQ